VSVLSYLNKKAELLSGHAKEVKVTKRMKLGDKGLTIEATADKYGY